MNIKINPKYKESEKMRFDFFRDQIVSEVKQGAKYKVLDVGCSQFDFNKLNDQIEVFGIDYIPSTVYDENHFSLCDLNKEGISFANDTFDFVIAGEILEHIKRPFEFIEELHRVLKPGGMLLLSTPNPYYYQEVIKELFGVLVLDDFEHLNLFSKNHLVAYAKKTGFELAVFKRYKFWIPYLKIMVFSMNTPRFLNYQNVYIFKKI